MPEIAKPLVAATLAANSEVLPSGPVAVAVTVSPTATGKRVRVAENVALPAAPIGTVVEAEIALARPRRWRRTRRGRSRPTVLSSEPAIVTVVPLVAAPVSTGKFCRLFGPVSPSPASFGVDAVVVEIDADAALAWIELPRTAWPVPVVIVDAVLAVEGDHVAGAGNGAADRVGRASRLSTPGSRVAERTGAGGVGADVVALRDVARPGAEEVDPDQRCRR